jgi:hypothetical protein
LTRVKPDARLELPPAGHPEGHRSTTITMGKVPNTQAIRENAARKELRVSELAHQSSGPRQTTAGRTLEFVVPALGERRDFAFNFVESCADLGDELVAG